MNRRWLIERTNREYLNYLSRRASISPVLAQILINRGLKRPDDVLDFLNPSITALSDPYKIHHMDKAVRRIKAALRNKEGIMIHGDYDVDGLTATAILMEALCKAGLKLHYFIPDRFIHGYGFNITSIEIAKQMGLKLIITVDCGITAFEAVAHAQREGIDVLITDHHEPLSTDVNGQEFLLPEAVAVLNPLLSNLDTALSGAGVALKLIQALVMDREFPLSEDDFIQLFDLAALGTLADVVPLVGENRVILKQGISIITEERRAGLKALKELSGLNNREVKSGLLSFTVIPRLNAPGRLGNANDVVRLLLSTSEDEVYRIAEIVNSLNSERQKIETAIYEEALNEITNKSMGPVIVLAGNKWDSGVLGIVASRLAEEFYRPTFLFTIEGNLVKGSARSIPPFDIYKGINQCKDLLLTFGGHKQAAGLKLHISNLPRFEDAICKIAMEHLCENDYIRILKIDSEVSLIDVNNKLIQELSMLEPFGYGNPEPLLGARMLNVLNPRVVGNNHLKMMLKQDVVTRDAVGFNMGGFVGDVVSSKFIDAAFIPTINEWNGGRYLQMNLKAIRPSGTPLA